MVTRRYQRPIQRYHRRPSTTYRLATIENVTDRQTTDRWQTDRTSYHKRDHTTQYGRLKTGHCCTTLLPYNSGKKQEERKSCMKCYLKTGFVQMLAVACHLCYIHHMRGLVGFLLAKTCFWHSIGSNQFKPAKTGFKLTGTQKSSLY